MAKRRMFSLDVVDTDSFLDLPASSQSLYFHLGMRADDDGFVSSPKRITAMVGAAGDDLKLLIAKGFVIPFESGVCVIRDWRVNNYIQRDRYTPSIYTEEKQRLSIAENGRYSHVDTQCIQDVSKSDTQVRIDKEREEIDNKAATPPRARFIPPTLEEVQAYCIERENSVDAAYFLDYYAANGWVQGKGKPIKDWKACVRTWERQGYGGEQSSAVPKPRQYDEAIPQLAHGAVIPPNKEFLAVLGDQKSGTNVEAPLSTIKQAVMEALAQGSREPINVNLVVDGKTLARVVVPNINNMTRAAGKPVLLY